MVDMNKYGNREVFAGKMIGSSGNGSSSSSTVQNNQILCCAYNSNGTVFVTGSSDTYARVCFNVSSKFLPVHLLQFFKIFLIRNVSMP